jgi:hypothetical protein
MVFIGLLFVLGAYFDWKILTEGLNSWLYIKVLGKKPYRILLGLCGFMALLLGSIGLILYFNQSPYVVP